jgi:hypothetical protein
MAQHRLWARRGFYRRGKKEVSACMGVSGRGGACLRVGVSQVRSEDKMATGLQDGDIIVLSLPSHGNIWGELNTYY